MTVTPQGVRHDLAQYLGLTGEVVRTTDVIPDLAGMSRHRTARTNLSGLPISLQSIEKGQGPPYDPFKKQHSVRIS